MTTSKELLAFTKSTTIGRSFFDQLKIRYRPLICPFDDLLNEVSRQSGKVAFDVGCGSGQFALLLAEFTDIKKIWGIDLSDKLILNARNLLKNHSQKVSCVFEKYNGTAFPQEIQEADYVFLIDVLHHIPRKSQIEFLTSIYKNMKHSAAFILKDIDAASPLVIFNKLHDVVFSGEIGNELSLTKVISILKSIGFKIEHIKTKRLYVYPHYTIRLSK